MLLKRENVFMDVDVGSADELFEKIGLHMVKGGYAKDSFVQALKDREKEFSTGLPAKAVGTAIPHVDAEHILIPAVAVVKLKNSIPFIMMGSSDTVIDVGVVFMLLLQKAECQLLMLQKLMGLLQDETIMQNIVECSSGGELYDLLKEII